ncbi:hypothetical protein T310_7299 [Rasamsonia emersonii CBS 393.64]|uniref:Protein PBN1 n=1 Tax=Rasamsonia emersonii (strain ATCC 16479 / CBS 393.64 / IMI 116815) TaxID=1408163 RepID=A0A0F4YKX0_RASE3|nr:hypothetical protein T310_7299 [Rasamsonia emersonii CBS 393.64]KKA18750.1 hypothetical protein T310_7299 [Rasamsonia emersonii CBS 393.64]
MRRRITYIYGAESPFDPDQQARVSNDALSIRGLNAAKEERLTFGFDEFPSELGKSFGKFSRIVMNSMSDGRLSGRTMLSRRSPAEYLPISFTTSPILSQRFASTSALQFHSLLPSLADLVTYIQQVICNPNDTDCQSHASSLLSADSVDIDYDSISHSLTFSGFWSKPPEGQDGWTEDIRKHNKGTNEKVEVGLLAAQKAVEPEELSMGGFLTVIGEDKKLKPTLFSFPSRHHPLPEDASYTASFESPTGLHPTLKISMPRRALLTRPPAPPDATCALHTYLTLPSTVFADKYQLSTTDSLFLNSHHLVALRSVSGETDLEAPDWVVPRWGSNLLLELATPESAAGGEDWNVTIPLHLRYLEPSETGYRSTSVPWPVVFWACTAEDGTKMGVNPFDRVNLGWDGLFGPRTMFFQLHPSAAAASSSEAPAAPAAVSPQSRLVEDIQVPVLQTSLEEGASGSRVRQIELGTVVVIVLGFVWVLWKLGLVVRSSGIGSGRRQRKQPARRQDKKDE